jgi:hypothetical protein
MGRLAVMTRLGFIFTNFMWSWSAVNSETKQVMFFPWDCYLDKEYFERTNEKRYLILHDSWATNPSHENELQLGYRDAVNNLNRVIDNGYGLTVMFQTPVKLLEYPKSSETAKIRKLHSASYFNANFSRDGEGYFATLISRHNT